ncbi:hypothetical protein [Halalkalibacter alkalisediminis]|uniref:Uncharacterized protein n=1 Tax=Halalkalibacter alkalisediminis TaxID=935616 RepID=A0ABV6NDA6_9BACI|nr:hypothetical protein [Halalkalibacter alkalisediminis]
MTKRKLKVASNYSALLESILLLQHSHVKEQKKSPTIAEISAITGDTEEHILESMELGRPEPYKITH